ncbi:MAG: cupin domain-containing protein [Desulfobacterales bacterium]|nr:cupin domain-containing protein [Desulfobacterales bacterium]
MADNFQIWVFGDHRNFFQDRLTLQALGQARRLADARKGLAAAVLLGHQVDDIAKEYIAHGAHRVLHVDHPRLARYQLDLFTSTICDLIREHGPDIFLLGASDFGRELAPRVAKRLEVGLCADCIELDLDSETGKLTAASPAFGGSVVARIAWSENRPWMATISPGIFKEQGHDDSYRGEIVRAEKNMDETQIRVKLISSSREPKQARRLEDAEVVITGGRGVKNADGFHYLRELAMMLGGEVGATRPAVDAHWTSHDNLIGQTGKSIKPRLLITCGTSGAIQYTAGIKEAETIVAVNRDPHAPIFRIADLGIVADANSFLPLLLAEIKRRQFQQITELYRTGREQEGVREDSTFGRRIKKLREDRKLTSEQLASQTGQTPEFIDRVEEDVITPPVSFLLQLARVLDIDPSSFLSEQEKIKIGKKRHESFVKRTQNYSYRTLTPGAVDKHLRAFIVTVEPKERHTMVEYRHPGEEFVYVMQGELEVTVGSKVYHLKPGETIHFDSETKHKLRNLSDEKSELIVVLYTP